MQNGTDNFLNQVISAEDCASCRLCCNFHRDSIWEAPCLSKEYTKKQEHKGETFMKGQTGAKTFIFKFADEGVAYCPKLDIKTGCTLCEDKPYECKIWPVRVMDKESEIVLGKYQNCPAIQGEKGKQLDELVNQVLRREIMEYTKKHKEIIRPYDKKYEIIRE